LIYVFDTNSLSNVLNNYYRDSFPSFWEKFDEMIHNRNAISVREARFELKGKFDDSEIELLKRSNADFFEDPTVEELAFFAQIYSVAHFQQNLDKKKLLQGGYFADPFIIAKAKLKKAVVVTEESRPKNGARIPNICDHFVIEYDNLQGFLVRENWRF
jgi:hypothetical protein